MSLVLAVGTQRGGVTDAQYVVLTANATLTDERVLTETANRIVITDGGAGGAVTLSPGALIVQTDQANTWTVGSQIIQPAVDTTTAFQVFDADGGDPVLSVDTVNESVVLGGSSALLTNPAGVYARLMSHETDSLPSYLAMAAYSSVQSWHSAAFLFLRARGTQAAPLIVLNNFRTFSMLAQGYDGIDTFRNSAAISSYIDGAAIGAASMPGRLQFETTPSGAIQPVSRLVIKESGLIGINQATPGAQLQVDTSGAAVKGQIIKAAAAQTAALFQLQDSTGGVVVDSGDGLAASEWVHNEGGINIDFRVESQTYDALFVDASEDSIDIMHHASGKIGMYAVAPTTQAAHIADPAGGATVDAEARTAINAILVAIENIGITLAA